MKYIRWIFKLVNPYKVAMTVMMLCHVLLAACAIGFVYISKALVDVAVAMFQGDAAGDLWIWGAAMVSIVLIRILLNALRS